VFVDVHGAVENSEDVQGLFVPNQVSDPVVAVQKNADALFPILVVPQAKFWKLTKDLNPIVNSEYDLPCRLFIFLPAE
jgi:hypothetical protein